MVPNPCSLVRKRLLPVTDTEQRTYPVPALHPAKGSTHKPVHCSALSLGESIDGESPGLPPAVAIGLLLPAPTNGPTGGIPRRAGGSAAATTGPTWASLCCGRGKRTTRDSATPGV